MFPLASSWITYACNYLEIPILNVFWDDSVPVETIFGYFNSHILIDLQTFFSPLWLTIAKGFLVGFKFTNTVTSMYFLKPVCEWNIFYCG